MNSSYTVVFRDPFNPAERKPLYITNDIQEAKRVLLEWECLGHINIYDDGFMSDSDISMDPNGDAFLRMGEDYGGGTCSVDSLIAFLVKAFPEKVKAAQGFEQAKERSLKVQQPILDEMA